MNRFIILIALSICLLYICGSEATNEFDENSTDIETSAHDVESRRRKTGHYFLHPYHGWWALSWIYWVKVKLIVVAFFVYTAFIWAVQYLGKFQRQCPSYEHLHYGHYGHYRSLENPSIVKLLQELQ